MTKVISLRVDDQLSEAIEYQAAANAESVSELIKRYMVDKLIDENPFINIGIIDVYLKEEDHFYRRIGEKLSKSPLKNSMEHAREKASEKFPSYDERKQAKYLFDMREKYK